MKTRAHTTLIAIAAGLLTLSALPVAAADQQRPGPPSQQQDRDRQDDRGRSEGRRDNENARGQDDRYGAWNAGWGARPAAPPRSFTRTSDWHRHVRACQQRYRSYNPATDRYTVRRGQTAVCRL